MCPCPTRAPECIRHAYRTSKPHAPRGTGFYTADVTNLLHTIFADLDTENKDTKLFIDAGAPLPRFPRSTNQTHFFS